MLTPTCVSGLHSVKTFAAQCFNGALLIRSRRADEHSGALHNGKVAGSNLDKTVGLIETRGAELERRGAG